MARVKLDEQILSEIKIVEKDRKKLPDGVLCRVTYPVCNIGEKNRNKRVYEREVWEKVMEDKEIMDRIERRALFGHAEHPETSQSSTPLVSHIITDMWIDEKKNKLYQTSEVLDTPNGKIVDTLIRANCALGQSTRAEGELEEVNEDGESYFKVIPDSYDYRTTDFTVDESTYGAYPERVERTVVKHIKAGVDEDKIDRTFAVKLLESMKVSEAKSLLETIQSDKHHTGCKCKNSEKKCTKGCSHAVKEAGQEVDYSKLADDKGLTGETKDLFVKYMEARWPTSGAKYDPSYAGEWADRFKAGKEYQSSDKMGQRILKDLDYERYGKMEENTKEHKLIIKSLHDAQAECSAGDWRFVGTGERTKEEIQAEFDKHLRDDVKESTTEKRRCPKCKSSDTTQVEESDEKYIIQCGSCGDKFDLAKESIVDNKIEEKSEFVNVTVGGKDGYTSELRLNKDAVDQFAKTVKALGGKILKKDPVKEAMNFLKSDADQFMRILNCMDELEEEDQDKLKKKVMEKFGLTEIINNVKGMLKETRTSFKSQELDLAEARAERDRLMEEVTALEAKLVNIKESYISDVKGLTEKVEDSDGLAKKEKEKLVKEMTVKATKLMEEKVNELAKAHKTEIEEAVQKARLEEYKDYRLKETRLKDQLPQFSLALLEKAKSREEIDSLLEKFRVALRDGILHSSTPSKIVVVKEEQVSPEQKTTEKFLGAMR